MEAYRHTVRERDGVFALCILTVGVLTVFALSQFGAALTASPRAGATVKGSSPKPATTATPEGVVNAKLHMFPVSGKLPADLMQPAVGQDGTIWFGEMGTNQLGRLDPATGKVISWTPPNGQYGIMDVAVDRNGMVWFTEQSANYLGSFDPGTQTFKAYPLGTPNGRPAAPQDLAIGSDGAVWFTEVTAGMIARLDPSTGAIHTWSVPAVVPGASIYPYGIALSSDGTVWFSELAGGTIGSLNPNTGAIHLFRAPTNDAEIFALALAPDGKVWFSELQYHKIGVLDPATGTIREVSIPQPVSSTPNLYDISVGSDGVVWVADMGQNAITRYEPALGKFTWYKLPDASSIPYGLALDSSGHVWFTSDRSPTNYVGELGS